MSDDCARRTMSAQEALKAVKSGQRVLVGGDFNDFWGTLGRSILVPAGFRGLPRRARTFPAIAPLRALDAVYVRGRLKIEPAPTARPRSARFASDHLPVAVDATFA